MKIRIFLFLGLMVYYSVNFAQNYKSMFSLDTTRWNVFEFLPDDGGTIVYYSFSDTILDSLTYHKIYREYDYIYDWDQPIGQGYICGFIREDTINGKYWFLQPIGNEYIEGLFMDLNLNQGDTFINYYNAHYLTDDEFIVDSVYYEGEKKIIEFSITHSGDENNYNIKFIEGVGLSNGFFMIENNWAEDFALLCKYNNDTLFYSTPYNINGNCYREGYGDIKSSHLRFVIGVYPNPTNGLINIELCENHYEELYLNVYNSEGALILKESINMTSFQFKISEPGVYFLEITDGIKKYSKKIIVTG
jgi:hypothetical protein